jgi:hypothetical protein
MQTQSQMTHAVSAGRGISGRHARAPGRTGLPGRAARRIVVTALLLSGLVAGSVAASSGHGTTGQRAAHNQTGVKYVPNTPWMY